MKSKILLYAILLGNLVYLSCGSKSKEEEFDSKEDKPFYPISAFIQDQLNKLDSVPLAVFKFTYEGEKKDSMLIQKPEARRAAEEFLQPDISSPALKKSYTETTFMDETINLVTITYTPKDDMAEVRKANVYINPENDKVKSIYIEKNSHGDGKTISKKLLWKADQNFEVITTIEKPGGQDSTVRVQYVWDGQ